SADRIADIRFKVGNHDYSYFFSWKQSPQTSNQVLISAAQAEIGSYRMEVILKSGEKAYGNIEAPFTNDPDSLESIAKKYGITVDELLRRKGLVTPIPRFQTRIQLPETFIEGQAIQIPLDESYRQYEVSWFVNNQHIAQL